MVLPSGLRTTRVIVYVQGALGVLNGALLIFGGSAFATALNLQGTGGTTLINAVGVLVLLVSALPPWGGGLRGRPSARARRGVPAFRWVSGGHGVGAAPHPPLSVVLGLGRACPV